MVFKYIGRVLSSAGVETKVAERLDKLWRRQGGQLAQNERGRLLTDGRGVDAGRLAPMTREAALELAQAAPPAQDEDFTETAIRGAAAFIFDYSNAHFEQLQRLRELHETPDRNLISAEVLVDKNISKHMKKRVLEFRNRIRFAISAIAHAVEVREDHIVLNEIRHSKIGPETKRRVERLSAGKAGVNVSFRSIAVSLEIFKRLNALLVQESRNAVSDADALEINLRSCIIVVETLDTIIGLLRYFELRGEATLRELKREVFADLDRGARRDADLAQRAEAEPDAATRDHTLRNLEARERGRAMARMKWEQIERALSSAKESVENTKSRIGALELRRDDAQNQAEFLQTVSVTLLADQSVAAVESLIDLGDMSVAYLSADEYADLLNLGVGDVLSLPERKRSA